MENWQERDARRDEIVARAVQAADRIILDGSDGSSGETDFLTAAVAERFMEKALLPLKVAMQRKDLKDDSRPQKEVLE